MERRQMPNRVITKLIRVGRGLIDRKSLITSVCAPALLILKDGFALERSIHEKICIDKDGNPIPWYTYPAIEYLKQLDFSEKSIYEFGCGNSSLFWAKRAKSVISVDENEDWYASRLKNKPQNLNLKLRATGEEYYNSILEEDTTFDVIIIDGNHDRDKCATNAVKKLSANGMVILDNSDRVSEFEEYSNAAQILTKADLIQIDFMGFGPINNFTWATTLFLTRTFDFKAKNQHQPIKSIGTIREKPGLESCKVYKNDSYFAYERQHILDKQKLLRITSLNNFRFVHQINIQINNQCNYALAHEECPVHCNKSKEVMETALVHGILDQLGAIGYAGQIMFSLYNEPMGDERFYDFCKYAKANCKSAKLFINTNGTYLNSRSVKLLEEIGVDYLFVSAYSVKEYSRLLALETKLPACVYPMILDDRLDIYNRNYVNCKTPCHAPFSDLCVNSRGEVVLCCLDWDSQYVYGNLHHQSLSDIVNSQEMTNVYSKLTHGKRELEICKRCNLCR
jgi:radical SAM protein with 4Fe4S-binding SPASM domain